MYEKQLLQLGVSAHVKGFEFLDYAIQQYVPHMKIIALYDMVAVKFNTTRSRAERAMRHAIKRTGEKITVSAFVAKYKILWKE